MAFTVTLAGKTFTEASFQGNAYADETDGFPAALQKIVEHVANAWVTTSTTSLTVGTGSKSLTVDASKPLGVGQYVIIARTSDATGTWMFGQVTAYDVETGALTVNVEVTKGAGTHTDWTVSLAGVRGPQGTLTSINDVDDVNTVAVAPSDGSPLVWDNGNGYWAPGEIKESMLSAAVQAKLNYTAPSKFDATTAPTANWDDVDTAGVGVEFTIGSVVIDTVGGEAYRCLDASTGAAVWIETTLGTDELGALAVKDTVNNADWSGTALSIGNGGTGQATKAAGFDALSPATTQGDLIYHNGTNNVRLAKGTALYVLRMNSGATAPEWAALSTPFTGSFESAEFAIPTSQTITSYAHGLGGQPKLTQLVARCKNTDNSYSPGDEIVIGGAGSSGMPVVAPGADSTNVYYVGNGCTLCVNKAGSGYFTPTNANWKFVLRAFR